MRRRGRWRAPPPGKNSQDGTEAHIATKSEALSDPGTEKLIPLRFVHLLPCAPSGSCPSDFATRYNNTLKAVQTANEVFKAAGVQFWVRAVERYQTPNLHDLREAPVPSCCGDNPPCQSCDSGCAGGGAGTDPRTWATVRNELRTIFPNAPSNAWGDSVQKNNRLWLRAVETLYGNWDELVVWVADNSCDLWSTFPHDGRGLVMNSTGLSQPYKLAHELGHGFGQVHTWNDDTWKDPWTDANHVRSDTWDLVYKPGTSITTPHKYYDSKSEAQADEASLLRIQTGNGGSTDSCSVAANGVVTCTIRACDTCYQEVRSTPSPALKGLGMTFGTSQGPNVMSYMSLGGTGPRTFSDSQIALIRRYIRFDTPLRQQAVDEIKPGAVASGRRPWLGAWNIREPSAKLDFDSDGKRDLGYWIPPLSPGVKGTFKVLLSSQAFSTAVGQHISADFGESGDVPVPADYDGDGRTDFAVYQPGGGINRNSPSDAQGYWRWCPTQNPPQNTTTSTCTSGAVVTAWGLREDVPLPGLAFQGANTPLLTTFRPRIGQWAWQPAAGGSYTVRTLGFRGSVPLAGDYDDDLLTDIAVYDPGLGMFELKRSQDSWTNVHFRSFGAKFVPAPSGTAENRSGAIPLAGIFAPRLICSGVCLPYPRRALSLFFPYDGTWNTMWDPIAGSSLHVCAWGIGHLDRPITNIDRNGDMWTDMAVHRAQTFDASAYVHIKNTTPSGGCGGSVNSTSHAFANRIRHRVFGVADMTGDAKSEIVFVDPDYGTIYWYTSESGYTSGSSRGVGNERMVFF